MALTLKGSRPREIRIEKGLTTQRRARWRKRRASARLARTMSIKLTRARYRGNKWVLLVCTIVFFPVAILLFMLDAVWIEQEITQEELQELERGSWT